MLGNPYLKRKHDEASTFVLSDMNLSSPTQCFRNPYVRAQTSSIAVKTNVHHDNPVSPLAVPASNVAALVISAAHKAGMDGIDRAKIDAIILKESGNSKFMQQQRKRDERVNQRIERLREKLRNAPMDWRVKLERQIDVQILEWMSKRDARAVKVVVDMDMFYMACELLDKPHLRNVPAVVGGPSMISTSNYAARRFGVRSAMPGYIGEALVDQLSGGKQKLVYCKHNFELYKAKSSIVRKVLSEYDPNLSAYSLDEAYLDISQYLLLSLRHPHLSHEELSEQVQTLKDRPTDESIVELLVFSPRACRDAAEAIVQNMRRRVQLSTGGLTCSAGLAPNFLLAKIASDQNKPDGQLTVDPNDVMEFLRPLPVRKICGIGRVTEKILNAFGIDNVAQLYENRALVALLFEPTSTSASFLLRASVGCSSSDGQVGESSEISHQKGISRERSFTAEESWNFINEKLESIATMLSSDMAEKDLIAGSISVKVKLHTFDCYSKMRTLPSGSYVAAAKDLAGLAAELLQEIKLKYEKSDIMASTTKRFAVRLLGVRCSNLCKSHEAITGVQKRLDDYAVRVDEETSAIGTATSINPYLSPLRCTKAHGTSLQHQLLSCPVCLRRFMDESTVFRHLDTCLIDNSIRSQPKRHRKGLVTDFFAVKKA